VSYKTSTIEVRVSGSIGEMSTKRDRDGESEPPPNTKKPPSRHTTLFRLRCAKESPAETKRRKEGEAATKRARVARLKAAETKEEATARKAKETAQKAAWTAKRDASETALEKTARKALKAKEHKVWHADRKANETPSDVVIRKAAQAVADTTCRAKRLANETHEETEARKTKQNTHMRNRYKTEPEYALAMKLRRRLRAVMKGKGYKKKGKTEKLLGCTWKQALEHLENNDRGLKLLDANTSIDHIKPFDAFKNLESPIEQRLVSHWSNLQLLTAVENMKKGSSHDHATWSVSEAGIKLLAFERELRAAAVNDDALVVYVDDSSDDDQDSEDDDE
jgi:hypothetical protein